MELLLAVLLASLVAADYTMGLNTNKIDVKTAYNEYCDICDDHTLCKFEGLGETCEGPLDGGVTHEEKMFILETHNSYRRFIAKGLESRGVNGSQPGASNMMKMIWDDELAKIAQHWADQCQFQHDTCRHDRRFKVGQNIYWNWRFPILKTVNWTAAMASWYDEVDKFDPAIASSYEFNPETGHYTQLMWHDSMLIGCGRRSYGPNKIYVCNYGPTGNWLSEPLYETGEPCSKCPEGSRCDDGLCSLNLEEIEKVEDLSLTLKPPSSDSKSFYNATPESTTEDHTSNHSNKPNYNDTIAHTEPSVARTELPIHLNLIDDLEIPDDAEIRQEIEDLKKRIRNLVDKIAMMNMQKGK